MSPLVAFLGVATVIALGLCFAGLMIMTFCAVRKPAQPLSSPDTTRTAPEGVSGAPGAGTGHVEGVSGTGGPGTASGEVADAFLTAEQIDELLERRIARFAVTRRWTKQASMRLQRDLARTQAEALQSMLDRSREARAEAEDQAYFGRKQIRDLEITLTTERRTNEALREALAEAETRVATNNDGWREANDGWRGTIKYSDRLRSTLSAVMAERDEIIGESERWLAAVDDWSAIVVAWRAHGDRLRSTLAALTAEWRVVMAERDGAVEAREAALSSVAP